MQIVSDVEPLPANPTPDVQAVRTFCVVWRRGSGELWKADVVADNPVTAVEAIVYDQRITTDAVIGVIDRSTIR